jgi:pyridoxal phosphate enzyme (YggS family)
MIAEQLESVRRRVRETCVSAGRPVDSVRIIAVSKTFGVDQIREAAAAGQGDFGESYAQEFRLKADALAAEPLRWHFIGHLQSNKVRAVLPGLHLLHSLDRISLAEEIQKRATSLGRQVEALIEVHTTDEATKTGVLPSDVLSFARSVAGYGALKVRGLMTMGPFSDDPEHARPCFRQLRDLQALLRREGPDGMSWDELSMGMSGDYHVAIQEGATLIRVGTAIFGERTVHTDAR